MMDSHNDSTGVAAVHTSSPFPFRAHLWTRPRPARPAGCQMELTRSQPALCLLSPVALEGKPSSGAKAASPQQIRLLCHSAGAGVFVSQCVHLSVMFVATQCLTSLLRVRSDSFSVIHSFLLFTCSSGKIWESLLLFLLPQLDYCLTRRAIALRGGIFMMITAFPVDI